MATDLEQVLGALEALLFRHRGIMQADGFADLLADGQHRVEGGERVLEDDADLLAANLADLVGRHADQFAAAELGAAFDAAAAGQ